MKHLLSKLLVATAILIGSMCNAEGKTYIVEAGDTWEIIARKWGVFVEELKAVNQGMADVYYGVEINLPDSSRDKINSSSLMSIYEREDENLQRGLSAVEENDFRTAHRYLTGSINRGDHTTSKYAYLYALCCEKTENYIDALKYYGKAVELINGGDYSATPEQIMALNSDIERVVPLAQAEAVRKEKERIRLENERRERAAREAREREERNRRRAQAWTNFGLNLLGVMSNVAQSYINSSMTPSYSAYSTPYASSLAAAGITIPPSLDPANFTREMARVEITYDKNGNPMMSMPGAAQWMRQSSYEVAAAAGRVGGNVGLSLQQQAMTNMRMSEMQAQWLETPHYPVQMSAEEMREQREMYEQSHRDFRESLTSGKDKVEEIRTYNQLKYGSSGSSTTSSSSSSSSSTSSSTTSSKSSSSASSSSSSSSRSESSTTTGSSTSTSTNTQTGNSNDSHQQFRSGRLNANSNDYTHVKYVTLYKKDGSDYKSFRTNVDLCKKGATYYINMGNTYYPAEGVYTGHGLNMRIIYGATALFFSK